MTLLAERVSDKFTKNNAIQGSQNFQRVQALSIADIPAMLALQDEAADGMAVMRSADDLAHHFAAGHSALGVFVQGKLVAQSLLCHGYAGAAHDFNSAAMIGGVLTSPAHRGKGLMGMLITASLEQAAADGHNTTCARVRLGNEASYRNFIKHGFTVAATGPSPDEPEHTVMLLVKNQQGQVPQVAAC